jgi:hypothetical protein
MEDAKDTGGAPLELMYKFLAAVSEERMADALQLSSQSEPDGRAPRARESRAVTARARARSRTVLAHEPHNTMVREYESVLKMAVAAASSSESKDDDDDDDDDDAKADAADDDDDDDEDEEDEDEEEEEEDDDENDRPPTEAEVMEELNDDMAALGISGTRQELASNIRWLKENVPPSPKPSPSASAAAKSSAPAYAAPTLASSARDARVESIRHGAAETLEDKMMAALDGGDDEDESAPSVETEAELWNALPQGLRDAAYERAAAAGAKAEPLSEHK